MQLPYKTFNHTRTDTLDSKFIESFNDLARTSTRASLVHTDHIRFLIHSILSADRTLCRKSALDNRGVVLLNLYDLRDNSTSSHNADPGTWCQVVVGYELGVVASCSRYIYPVDIDRIELCNWSYCLIANLPDDLLNGCLILVVLELESHRTSRMMLSNTKRLTVLVICQPTDDSITRNLLEVPEFTDDLLLSIFDSC